MNQKYEEEINKADKAYKDEKIIRALRHLEEADKALLDAHTNALKRIFKLRRKALSEF